MADSEKPFACSSLGCNMSFTNEDHLVVHKKKHDMSLNFGTNGKNTFVADQTPTPTRFIRNCEEVGLFQDLQNVNPFEETFRRAVEAGKTGSLSEPEVAGDDTLHTPHIFPNLADMPPSSVILDKKQSEDALQGESIIDKAVIEESGAQEVGKSVEIIIKSHEEMDDHSSGLVVRETEAAVGSKIVGTSPPTPNLQINGQEVQLLLKTADGKLMQLSAIPLCDNRTPNDNCGDATLKPLSALVDSNNEPILKSIIEDPSSVKKALAIGNDNNNRMSLAKMRLKQALSKNGAISTRPPHTGLPESSPAPSRSAEPSQKLASNVEQRKKQEVQARNRASSMRARAKRKAWIQQLQRTANSANEKNTALQEEVKALRTEVAKLRALLLAHESCPVTKAIEKGTLLSSNPSVELPLVPGLRAALPTSVVHARKRVSSLGETPIAPKIPKSSSLSVTKPHAILPKAEVRPCPVVKEAAGLKIVPVRSLASDGDHPKRILLVPSSSRRLELVRSSSRSIIHVNPSCQLQFENAASKCTAT